MGNLSGNSLLPPQNPQAHKPLFSSRLEEVRVDLTSQTSL